MEEQRIRQEMILPKIERALMSVGVGSKTTIDEMEKITKMDKRTVKKWIQYAHYAKNFLHGFQLTSDEEITVTQYPELFLGTMGKLTRHEQIILELYFANAIPGYEVVEEVEFEEDFPILDDLRLQGCVKWENNKVSLTPIGISLAAKLCDDFTKRMDQATIYLSSSNLEKMQDEINSLLTQIVEKEPKKIITGVYERWASL